MVRYVTRKRPQVDRCASAWLLKRFVDTDAEFDFMEEGDPLGDAIPRTPGAATHVSGFSSRRRRCHRSRRRR